MLLHLFALVLILLTEGSSRPTIKHVVVVMEENRSFDHLFGWYPGVNGLKGTEFNPVNTSDPHSKRVYVDKKAPTIARCDPNHGTGPTTLKIFGQQAVDQHNFTVANMNGFVETEIANGNHDGCDVMSALTPSHLPILSTLAREFAIFDRFFAAHPGPTWPNRMFTLSATSAGSTDTGPWYHNINGKLFPQKTIFRQVAEYGLTWKNYYNDTPWELFMEDIANHPENLASMEQFYRDARTGNLPSFSWINPRSGINLTTGIGSNDMHPDHDVSAAEQFYKDIYEAIRASPSWEETLLLITFDEHGGFYDHVPTPLNVPPPGDGEKSYPLKDFLFDRLGVRIPTIAISPWIKKGLVVSEPPKEQKPYPNSEFTLTSIMATARILLGMPSVPLTKRDAWSATFEHILSLETPRSDCPVHLPNGLPPTPPSTGIAEHEQELNELQHHILTVVSHLAGVSFPKHVKHQGNISDWIPHHLHRHFSVTKAWKQSKKEQNYTLIVQPKRFKFVDQTWVISTEKGVNYTTISTKKLKTAQGIPYCIDAGSPAKAGSRVTVSQCFPSITPSKNRDTAQHWIAGPDVTFRPISDPSLCLTKAAGSTGTVAVYLLPCSDAVTQHWAYHGPAPGDSGPGFIYYGDDTNSLGLIDS